MTKAWSHDYWVCAGPDQLLVCGIGDHWSKYLNYSKLIYMSLSDYPDHPGSILYHCITIHNICTSFHEIAFVFQTISQNYFSGCWIWQADYVSSFPPENLLVSPILVHIDSSRWLLKYFERIIWKHWKVNYKQKLCAKTYAEFSFIDFCCHQIHR